MTRWSVLFFFLFFSQRVWPDQEEKRLTRYRGFYESSQELERFCQNRKVFLDEKSSSAKEKMKLSFAATLQLVGLELTSRALGKYMNILGFGKEEHEILVGNLIKRSCSPNTSVISLKQLEKKMISSFEDVDFELPSIVPLPLFYFKD